MQGFIHDFAEIISSAFDMKKEDMSMREVTPSLNYNLMSKDELLELQSILKRAIPGSKASSGIVAIIWALAAIIIIISIIGPVQGIIAGLVVFFVMYEVKRHQYWRFFFSFTDHFYKHIKPQHLFMAIISYFSEYGLFFMYTAPFKMLKTSREFAKANNGRKMNEHRATYELNLVNQLLAKR